MKNNIDILFITILIILQLASVYLFLSYPSMCKLMNTIVCIFSFMAMIKWIDRFGGVKEIIIYSFITLTLFILGLLSI